MIGSIDDLPRRSAMKSAVGGRRQMMAEHTPVDGVVQRGLTGYLRGMAQRRGTGQGGLMRRRLVLANLAALTLLAGVAWSQQPPPTPVTDAAIEDVRREVEHSQTVAPDLPREYVAALVVNSYVAGHVSRVAYEYRTEIARETPPSGVVEIVVEDAFATGTGLCGAATLAALALYDALDVEARSIVVWYTEPDGDKIGHIMTEVFYEGSWHYFDPTWNAYHTDGETVYSLLEVVEMSPAERARTLVEHHVLWAQINTKYDPMAFTGYSPLRVELDDRVVYSR